MHRLVTGIGTLALCLGVISLVVAMIAALTHSVWAAYLGVVYGVSLFISGALLLCFGQIGEDIAATRAQGEEQTALLRKLVDGRQS